MPEISGPLYPSGRLCIGFGVYERINILQITDYSQCVPNYSPLFKINSRLGHKHGFKAFKI